MGWNDDVQRGGDMFGIGPLELVVIAIVAVVVFGPDRLPEFARTAGRLLRQVRQMVTTAPESGCPGLLPSRMVRSIVERSRVRTNSLASTMFWPLNTRFS